MKRIKQKGFTLIELIVVMAIIAILVLIAAPKFMGYTEKAKLTQVINDIKVSEKAAEQYYMQHDLWPRDQTATPYNVTQLNTWVDDFINLSGETVTLESGDYYEVDWDMLKPFMAKPNNNFRYIIQNPVGDIYYANELTQAGEPIFSEDAKKPVAVINVTPENNITTADTLVWSYTNSYSLKGKEIVAAEWENNLSKFTTPGEQTVKLRVKDSDGNWSEWIEKKIEVAPFTYNSNNFKISKSPQTDGKICLFIGGSSNVYLKNMEDDSKSFNLNTTNGPYGIVYSEVFTLTNLTGFQLYELDGTNIEHVSIKINSIHFATLGNIYYHSTDNYLWKYNIQTKTKTKTSFYSSKAIIGAIPYNENIILFNETATANQINTTSFNLETNSIVKSFAYNNIYTDVSNVSVSGNKMILMNPSGINVSIDLTTNIATNLSNVNGKIVHAYKDKYVIYGQGAEIYLVDSNFTKIKTLGYYYNSQHAYYGLIIGDKLYVNRQSSTPDIYNLN